MHLAAGFLAFLVTAACGVFGEKTDIYAEQLKCESVPYRSFYHTLSGACFIRPNRACNADLLPFPQTTENLENVHEDLRMLGLLKKGEDAGLMQEKICAFRIRRNCDINILKGNECFTFSSEATTWQQAMEKCNLKDSTLFVPRSDNDIQRMIQVVREDQVSTIQAVWIGLSNKDGRWVSHDKKEVDYYRWDSEKTAKSGELSISLIVNGSWSGYAHVNKAGAKLNFICHRYSGSEYHVTAAPPLEKITYPEQKKVYTKPKPKKPVPKKVKKAKRPRYKPPPRGCRYVAWSRIQGVKVGAVITCGKYGK